MVILYLPFHVLYKYKKQLNKLSRDGSTKKHTNKNSRVDSLQVDILPTSVIKQSVTS